jgi:hypothetical protein
MLRDGAGKCTISCSVGRLRMDHDFRLGRLWGSSGISEPPPTLVMGLRRSLLFSRGSSAPFSWQARNDAAFAGMIAHSAHWRISGISEWGHPKPVYPEGHTLLTFACFWDPLWRPGPQFTPGPSVNGNHGTGLQGPSYCLPRPLEACLRRRTDASPRETEALSCCRFPTPHDDSLSDSTANRGSRASGPSRK